MESQPDGTTNTVFTNGFGQVMLSVYTDGSGNKWMTYNRYDSSGHLILTANPSAVTGYSTSYADLVDFNGGNSSDLSSTGGLITDAVYATVTTATSTTAGNAAGYLEQTEIQQGQTGTPVVQEAYTYLENTAGGINYFNVASDTRYRNTNGTGGETTSYAYTFQSGTNQIASVTTTLPIVTTAENGSGTANTTVVVDDTFGRARWTKDASGYINYKQYDNLTGAVVKTITDVNTSLTGTFTNLPSGWTTPTGGPQRDHARARVRCAGARGVGRGDHARRRRGWLGAAHHEGVRRPGQCVSDHQLQRGLGREHREPGAAHVQRCGPTDRGITSRTAAR